MKSKIKAYLFDFDGTLVDTMGGFADIAGNVIHNYHPEISFSEARRRYLETSGVPFFQQLEIIFPAHPKNREIANIFEETKKEGFFRQKFSDDVRVTISELRKQGYIVGVCSNNFQELIDQFIARERLEFDIVLGYREGFEKGKAHFDYVMKKFNLLPHELVFVGDSLKDADKAKANGIRFIALCGTFTAQDFLALDPSIITITNIRELLTV
ncbi:MAG: HAD-IA family hydrolase [Spirochaetes bacterium]|nr:HAD-IA family hydrolase [Spirochaetota bacterium]